MPRATSTPKRGRGKVTPEASPHRRRRRIVDGIMIGLNVLYVLVLLATAYGGYLSPLKYGGTVGILPLCFPFAVVAGIVLIAIDVLISRRAAIVTLCGLVFSGGPLLDFFPMHIGSPKASAGADTFTLMTYNVFQFMPRGEESGSPGEGSPTLQYILDRNPDVVCLQEALILRPHPHNLISKTQSDSIFARYPNVIHSDNGQCVLSKLPIDAIHLNTQEVDFAGADIGAYRLTLPSGRLVGLFNVHLNSYQLNDDDKELYRDLTKLHREPISDVRSQLLDKLSAAAVGRARQAQQLLRWIRLYGGPDAIVCGDFNDVTNCYAVHALADAGFRDVYSRVGFGYMYTYNANRLYFCIDHILTRGDIVPVWLKKGALKSSDHYPLEVELSIAQAADN